MTSVNTNLLQPVIVRPTQLVPVLPSATTVVKRVTQYTANTEKNEPVNITPTLTPTSLAPPVQSQQSHPSLSVFPWTSLVPLLTATPSTNSVSPPPPFELSPPLSAPPITMNNNQSTRDLSPHDKHRNDTDDVETMEIDPADADPLPLPTEEDDDVFENDNTTEQSNDTCTSNKRRSQSLSSLQSAKDQNSQVKVMIDLLSLHCDILTFCNIYNNQY